MVVERSRALISQQSSHAQGRGFEPGSFHSFFANLFAINYGKNLSKNESMRIFRPIRVTQFLVSGRGIQVPNLLNGQIEPCLEDFPYFREEVFHGPLPVEDCPALKRTDGFSYTGSFLILQEMKPSMFLIWYWKTCSTINKLSRGHSAVKKTHI